MKGVIVVKGIYKNNIYGVKLKFMEINGNAIPNMMYETYTIKEDAKFYLNRFNVWVCLDTQNVYDDLPNAKDYLAQCAIADRKVPNFGVSYIDFTQFKPDRLVSNKEFRQIKRDSKKLIKTLEGKK